MTQPRYDDLKALFNQLHPEALTRAQQHRGTDRGEDLTHLARMLSTPAASPHTATSARNGTPVAGSTSGTPTTADVSSPPHDYRHVASSEDAPVIELQGHPAGQPDLGVPIQQHAYRDPGLHPGQQLADAEVDAVAEG
jgi:hypothetical protein